ncbi:MAG: HAMP domain-containing sensor histidine kinase [Lachnospiraceae bacterium]|nr:HAMP domain-containing sensor histidine kinase [Lachnospiraceae bacterium]
MQFFKKNHWKEKKEDTPESMFQYHVDSIRGVFRYNLKSFRVWIFLLIVILAWVPFLFLNEYIISQTRTLQVEQQVEELQYQGMALSRQMSRSVYLENVEMPGLNATLNAEINLLADIYDGRILVVNESFRIVKDTYSTDTDKYTISREVLNCFKKGEDSRYEYYKEGQYVEFTVPIYDQALKEIKGVLVFSTSTRNIETMVEEQKRKLQIMEVAVCILLSVIAFFASGILLRPFKKLENELNRANQGDMDPIQVPDCQETERIAAVYNESLLRLKHLDESRQEFVSNVSHELKTPITSIRILADSLISMGEAPVELYREFMEDISNEIDRESRIIDDLLEMVRLDRTKAELSVQRVNMNDLLESVLKRLKGTAEKRNIVVTLECMRPVVADVDELKFTRVITNLVENAIKYNRDSGSVTVSLNADQTYFYVKIVDTGVGIPDDEVGKVFERFYRVDKARSRETGGTGLGLAICKDIVQLHHGVIRVSSDFGVGTTFVVRIPLVYIP